MFCLIDFDCLCWENLSNLDEEHVRFKSLQSRKF